MNPYVYARRSSDSGQLPPAPGAPSLPALAKSVFTAAISPAIAFAVVMLAAGSVSAMSAVAYAEINQGSDAPVAHHVADVAHSQVLGDSTSQASTQTIDDSSLEASASVSAKISAKPVSYDSTVGRWDYDISYKISNLSDSGSLYIGSHLLQSGITASGSADTAAILKPSHTYRVSVVFSDSSGSIIGISQYQLKTKNFKSHGNNRQDQQEQATLCGPTLDFGPENASGTLSSLPVTNTGSASSTPQNFCIKTDDGKTICPATRCLMPEQRGGIQTGDRTSSSTPPRMGHDPQNGEGQEGMMPGQEQESGGQQQGQPPK